jgi:CubicO group peptidase (beta-lactamase class C family)
VVGVLRQDEDTISLLRHGTLAALARQYRVPGAQIVIHHGGETAAVEVGELELRTGRRVTPDTAFPAGSISKSFTATVAMILVADGDLELDAPVGDYLPELPDLADQLTLRQLLSHTSGLASDPETADASGASARRYVADHCRRRNLVLPPGSGFSYSNLGYIVVGRLIEATTGMTWCEAVESILLRPLGIDPAFVGAPQFPPAVRPIATGHSVNPVAGRTRPVRQSLTPAEAPACALALSAMDLVSLGLLHVGSGVPDLLPPTETDQMRRPVPAAEPFGLADGWGLGLALYRHGTTGWVGHDGNADGTSCYFRVDPAGGRVIAFTSNANTGVAMWQAILAEAARAGVPIGRSRPPTPQGQPTGPPPGCAGSYANGDVEFVVTARDGGRLYLTTDGDAPVALTFHGDLTFSVRDPISGRLVPDGRFLRDPETGKVHGIQVGGRVARRQTRIAREAGRRLIA